MKIRLALGLTLLVALAFLLLQPKTQAAGPPEPQAAGSPDRASTIHTGKLQGRIMNTIGKPVKGATVVLTDTATHEETRTKANSKGKYNFSGLFPGTYTVRAEAAGFKSASDDTRIANDKVAKLDLKLTNE